MLSGLRGWLVGVVAQAVGPVLVRLDGVRDGLDAVRDRLPEPRPVPGPIVRTSRCPTDGCGCASLMCAPLFTVERGSPFRVEQAGTALTCPRCGAAWTEDAEGNVTLTARSRVVPPRPAPERVDAEGREVINELADNDLRWRRGHR